MTAFYIARVKVKNEEKLQDYSSKAMEIFSGFQGEIISKGQLQKNDQQSQDHDFAVVMQFPTLEKLNQAINSDEYQAILPIRNAGADVNISIYQ